MDGFSFDWPTIKRYRDRYIQRLNGIYESGLDKLNVSNMILIFNKLVVGYGGGFVLYASV